MNCRTGLIPHVERIPAVWLLVRLITVTSYPIEFIPETIWKFLTASGRLRLASLVESYGFDKVSKVAIFLK